MVKERRMKTDHGYFVDVLTVVVYLVLFDIYCDLQERLDAVGVDLPSQEALYRDIQCRRSPNERKLEAHCCFYSTLFVIRKSSLGPL